jgi:cyclase
MCHFLGFVERILGIGSLKKSNSRFLNYLIHEETMLAKRVIATILLSNGMIVQSKQFKHTNVIGNAKTAVDFFTTWDIDEIVILDVSRTDENRGEFLKIVEGFGNKCFVPLAVGGWNRNLQDITDCLNAGADKVVINTQALASKDFISNSAHKFGSQCIVVSLDVKDNNIFVDKGRQELGYLPELCAGDCELAGAGEIYLTSINHDGMGRGYDLELIREVASVVSIPVIASGGCGKWEHMAEAFDAGADAVSAANIFHYSEHSTKKAKEYLMTTKYNIRPASFMGV